MSLSDKVPVDGGEVLVMKSIFATYFIDRLIGERCQGVCQWDELGLVVSNCMPIMRFVLRRND